MDDRYIHSLKVHNYHWVSETPLNYECKILWYIRSLKVGNNLGVSETLVTYSLKVSIIYGQSNKSPLYSKNRGTLATLRYARGPNVQYLRYWRLNLIQLCKNYLNLKHCIGQKFNVNDIKATHRTSNFLNTLVSQEIFASIGLRKNLF